MRNGWKILLLFCAALSLGGCGKQELRAPAVVTKVELQYTHADTRVHRCYTEEAQIRAVLDCLRLHRSKGTAQVDPERVMGDVFTVSVHMSDGQTHIYRHRAGQYLSRDSRPWQRVDPKYSQGLYELLFGSL